MTIGCLAGAMQSIVAAPLDSVKIRFEVSDLLEGKHSSMYQFAKSTLKDLGIASAYRGFSLTLVRVITIVIITIVVIKYNIVLISKIGLTDKYIYTCDRTRYLVDCFSRRSNGLNNKDITIS